MVLPACSTQGSVWAGRPSRFSTSYVLVDACICPGPISRGLHKLCVGGTLCMGWIPQQILHKLMYGLDAPTDSPQAMCQWTPVYEWYPQQVLHKIYVGGNLCMGWTPLHVLHKLSVGESMCMYWTPQQVHHRRVYGRYPPTGYPQAMCR